MKRDPKQPRLEPKQPGCDHPGCGEAGIYGFGCFGANPGKRSCAAHQAEVEAAELAERQQRLREIEARNAVELKPKQGDLLE